MTDAVIEVLKLKAAGDKATLDVSNASLLPFGEFPEIEFVGRDEAGRLCAVRVPQKSADRQLARLDMAEPKDAIGYRITFKRDPNSRQPSKPYWGLYIEGNGTGGANPSPRQAPATSAISSGQPAVAQPNAPATSQAPVAPAPSGHELYAKITAWVLKEIVPQYKAVGITPTQEGTAAICATLFIAKNGRH